MTTVISPSLELQIVNVKENKAFKKGRKMQQIVDIIVRELKKNPNREKHDVSCIMRCCELIENLVKKKYHMDKFDIVVKVFTTLFGVLAGPEVELLKKTVDAILDCKLIKKVALSKSVISYLKRVFTHNFLFRDE